MPEPEERFFYHSFPRPGPSADAGAKGLKILQSICRNGLLLVPERVSWHDPTGTRPGDRVYAFQRRICFTELAPSELPRHAEVFGQFALEFEIEDLRAWGLLPVIYVPDSPNRDPSLDWAGVSLLARLADASQVIAALVETQQLTAPTITMDLRIRDGGVHTRNFDERETAAIRDYVAMLQGAPGQRLTEVVGALRAISSLFYPTEHPQYTGLLGYYRQREWRLFSGPIVNGRPTTRVTTPAQQDELLEIDRSFFSRTLPFPTGVETLAAKSHYLGGIGGRHPLAVARRIVVPHGIEVQAGELLNELGFEVPIVALSSLAPKGEQPER